MSVDAEVKVDMKLQVGELSQTVEVTSEAAMLKTERSDVATTYSQKQVAELPVPEPTFHQLSTDDSGRVVVASELDGGAAGEPARLISYCW